MDLLGWDVICAISANKLNELLAEQFNKNPASLSYSSDTASIQASFGPWSIVPGGTLKKLHMALPIVSGTVATPENKLPLDGVTVVIELELAFLNNANGTTNDLVFNLVTPAGSAGDPTPGSVFVVNADLNQTLAGKGDDGSAKMTLHDNLPQCLIANKDKLGYLFSSLNLTPTGDGAWLIPKRPAYKYVNGTGGLLDYLAIFSVIGDKDTSTLNTDNIDQSLCDGQSDVCVAYTKGVFLEHVIKPHLSKAYAGTTDANFVMNGDTIKNQGAIILPEVDHWGTGYYPHLDTLTINVSGANIATSSSGSFDITGLSGASVDFSVSTSATCGFDTNTKSITLTKNGDPNADHNTHIPWYDYVAAAAFLPFLGPLVAGIVVGVVYGVMDAVSEGVAGQVDSSNKSGSGNLPLAQWSAAAFQWPGSDQWTVNNALLADAFAMRCTMKAAGPPTPVSPAVVDPNEFHPNPFRRCDVASWFGGDSR